MIQKKRKTKRQNNVKGVLIEKVLVKLVDVVVILWVFFSFDIVL